MDNNKQVIVMSRDDIDEIINRISLLIEQDRYNQITTQPIQSTKYLTRKEVSSLLHVDLSTLWRWDRSGILPACHTAGRMVLYTEDSVNQFILSHK